jgi:hypothetical protein
MVDPLLGMELLWMLPREPSAGFEKTEDRPDGLAHQGRHLAA